MAIEVGGGVVDVYDKFVKDLADKKKPKVRSAEKRADIVSKANSPEFRQGWDRIFGERPGDQIQKPDQANP